VVYDELRDEGLVVIAVALDTGGADAVRASVLASGHEEPYPRMRQFMGWSDELWSRAARPTYPCLIDTEHVLSELYQMTNVPMAVWIDERGRIVRPTETAGFGEGFRRMDPDTMALPEAEVEVLVANRTTYVDALRDWVRNGPASEFALDEHEVLRRMRRPAEGESRAGAHARLGRYLLEVGDNEGAAEHYREATRLAPEKWTYRRQSMVLAPERIGTLNGDPEFFAVVAATPEGAYYPPVQMPGIVARGPGGGGSTG
jgi:hypothetical protein